jgi:hypothetical protein
VIRQIASTFATATAVAMTANGWESNFALGSLAYW